MEQQIIFRDMNLEDLEMMVAWRNEEDVKKYYGNPSFDYSHEYIINKYKPRILKEDKKVPIIIEYEHEPIGYLQFYTLEKEEILKITNGKSSEVGSFDLFIGSSKHRNKGLGTIITRKLITKFEENRGIHHIVIKVLSNNHRAIKCYEKCGFRIRGQENNRNLILMEYKR